MVTIFPNLQTETLQFYHNIARADKKTKNTPASRNQSKPSRTAAINTKHKSGIGVIERLDLFEIVFLSES